MHPLCDDAGTVAKQRSTRSRAPMLSSPTRVGCESGSRSWMITSVERGSLANAQWDRLEPLLPVGKKPGRPWNWTRRRLIDGIRWRTRTGGWGSVDNGCEVVPRDLGQRLERRVDAVRLGPPAPHRGERGVLAQALLDVALEGLMVAGLPQGAQVRAQVVPPAVHHADYSGSATAAAIRCSKASARGTQ
ncbi:transposase [Streptomyces sp. NPDC051896]|uniref:transposase n=1 Tax=Streptomyces sp. NPDC051896 TaxID=3155416 RepID=UPI00342DEDAE